MLIEVVWTCHSKRVFVESLGSLTIEFFPPSFQLSNRTGFHFSVSKFLVYFIVLCLLGGHPFTCECSAWTVSCSKNVVVPQGIWANWNADSFCFSLFFCILIWGYREFLLNILYCRRTGMRHEIYIKIIYWIECKITISDADIVRERSWRAARNGNCACLYGHHHLGCHFRIR